MNSTIKLGDPVKWFGVRNDDIEVHYGYVARLDGPRADVNESIDGVLVGTLCIIASKLRPWTKGK